MNVLRAVVFDFGGTLVDSNAAKRLPYFEIFTPRGFSAERISQAVDNGALGSRTEVIRELVAAWTSRPAERTEEEQVEADVSHYTERVDALLDEVEELPGATALLRDGSERVPLYLSSLTPEEPLRKAVERRGWAGYFRKISGYPRRKGDFLLSVRDELGCAIDSLLMVGDGESDRLAAEETGARFYPIRQGADLARVGRLIMEQGQPVGGRV